MRRGEDYTISYWKGMKKYDCMKCPFDTLNKEAMREHIRKEHTEVKKEPVSVPIYDRFGNLQKYKEVK
jgi:hypothetical protein